MGTVQNSLSTVVELALAQSYNNAKLLSGFEGCCVSSPACWNIELGRCSCGATLSCRSQLVHACGLLLSTGRFFWRAAPSGLDGYVYAYNIHIYTYVYIHIFRLCKPWKCSLFSDLKNSGSVHYFRI